MPGPLDNLPRPLSERDRRGGRRRLTALVTAAVVVAVIAVAANSVASNSPVGAGSPVSAAQPTEAPPDVSPDELAGVVASPAAELGTGIGSSGTIATGKVVAPAVHDGPDIILSPSKPKPPAPETLKGYRWPLAHARLTLPFGPTAVGRAGSSTASRSTTASTSRRSAATGSSRRTTASSWRPGRHFDRADRLGRRPRAATSPGSTQAACGRRCRSSVDHRRRQRLPKHLRPLRQGRRQAGQTSRPASCIGYEGATGRATGCHLHYGLFSPLEAAQFGDRAGRAPSG